MFYQFKVNRKMKYVSTRVALLSGAADPSAALLDIINTRTTFCSAGLYTSTQFLAPHKRTF